MQKTDLHQLYEKVARFEQGLSPQTHAVLNCKRGCAQCCHVDLSVFEVEANAIRSWFQKLPEAQVRTLREQWQKPRDAGGLGCVFLRDHACTIYEARPLICRTQGMAFSFLAEAFPLENGVKTVPETQIDICPLNGEALAQMESREILNLDLLNRILSAVENAEAGVANRARVPLADLWTELLRG